MRTKQRSNQCRIPRASMLIAIYVIIFFCYSRQTLAQQQQWSTSGNDIFNANSGNVGIGTTTPGVRLDLLGSNVPYGGQLRLAAPDFAQITFFDSNNLALNATGRKGSIYYDIGSSQFVLHNQTGPILLNPSDGSIGIGTFSPAYKLDVRSSSNIIGRFSSTAAANSQVLIDAPNGFNSNLTLQHAGNSKWYLGNRASNDRFSFISAQSETEHVALLQNGNLGVGTISPSTRFEVVGPGTWVARFKRTDNSNGGILVESPTGFNPNVALAVSGVSKWYLLSNSSNSDSLQFWDSSGAVPRFTLTQAGTVGLGTATPNAAYKLDVSGNINATALCINNDCKTTWPTGTSQWATNGTTINYSGGNVGIGTGTVAPVEKLEVVGNIKVSGNINAKYQDVAEWVQSSQQLLPGTVVIVDSSKSNHVIASTQPYDSRIAGVISRQPGLTLGEEAEGRVLVATTGRVKVRVDATAGPIEIGDLLVTGNLEGVAMKSIAVNIGGVRMHRPGTLIGKALEPLPKGTGEILVLLSLQ